MRSPVQYLPYFPILFRIKRWFGTTYNYPIFKKFHSIRTIWDERATSSVNTESDMEPILFSSSFRVFVALKLHTQDLPMQSCIFHEFSKIQIAGCIWEHRANRNWTDFDWNVHFLQVLVWHKNCIATSISACAMDGNLSKKNKRILLSFLMFMCFHLQMNQHFSITSLMLTFYSKTEHQ